jgi:hypothetical protein
MECNGCILVSLSLFYYSNWAFRGRTGPGWGEGGGSGPQELRRQLCLLQSYPSFTPLCPLFSLNLDLSRQSQVSTIANSTLPGGGVPTTTNRTKWPVTGGAIAVQPGWFQGHATAFFYMNLGFGTNGPDGGPPNMSNPMVPVFQIVGPSRNPYPGTFCLPQVPLPANATVKVGDNATIQVVETAVHGAALFSVSTLPPARSLRSIKIKGGWKKLTYSPSVRRHHLCAPRRRSRGQLLELL